MADNVELNPGTGGSTIATDDVAGVQYQRVKVDLGGDGAASPLVRGQQAMASSIPVVVANNQSAVTVDGSGVTQPVSHAALTELAAAINASSQMDVNIAASNATVAVSNAGLTELAAAIDTEVQVDVVGALPAGNNNIGDVDVASVVPGTGATNLGKAEDAAHTTGDVGVMALAVRQSSQSDFGADGDYVPLSIDDDGGLRVSIVAGAGSGGTAAADDADFSAGSTQGTPAMGVYESTPTSVTDGDLGTVGITETRAMRVSVDNASIAVTNAGLTELAGAIDTEVQCDIVGALPAGTNAIGKLAANSGVDIGDVDVTSVTPGTTATSLGKAEDAGHSSGDVGVMALTVRQDAAAALGGTDADYQPLITDANGRLHVNVGNTVTVGSHAVTNAGTFAVQVDGNALTALQLIDDPVIQDDNAFTPGTTKVMMVGFQADESSTDSVDEGDGGAARMTLDRKILVQPQPHTAGGLTIFRSLDLDETEEEVKGTAGQVYSVWASNMATSTRFLKFYNATAANVSVGSTTPVITIALPGNSTDDISAHFAGGGYGIAFDTAITVAATTGIADADTGAPGANEVLVNIFYK